MTFCTIPMAAWSPPVTGRTPEELPAALRYGPGLPEQASEVAPAIEQHDLLLLTEKELEKYLKNNECIAT